MPRKRHGPPHKAQLEGGYSGMKSSTSDLDTAGYRSPRYPVEVVLLSPVCPAERGIVRDQVAAISHAQSVFTILK
jgi:hypothetical protein